MYDLSLEHIDPRWSEGRDYQLVCGYDKGPLAKFNEVMADYSYNSGKGNRFVPYRVKGYPAPINCGDLGEFLINGDWVVCEFAVKGGLWWQESNRIGNNFVVTGQLNGRANAELGRGFCSPGVAQQRGLIGGRKGGVISRDNKTGIHAEGGRTTESLSLGGQRSGRQRWRCLVTGKVSGPGPLTCYQRKRGIDTSLRERLS